MLVRGHDDRVRYLTGGGDRSAGERSIPVTNFHARHSIAAHTRRIPGGNPGA